MSESLKPLRSSLGVDRPRPGRGDDRRPSERRLRPSADVLEGRLVLAAALPNLGALTQFAVLGLKNTQVNNGGATIVGNEAVSQGGTLRSPAPSAIAGSVTEASAGQYSGTGTLAGGIAVNPATLSSVDNGILGASALAARLPATQVLKGVGVPTTVNGNGHLNVIAVNGDIKSSLTLDGSANDIFIINVKGNVNLSGGASLKLGGGVTASHVLYNVTSVGGEVSSQAGSEIDGTLLAPADNVDLSGTIDGEVTGGGAHLNLAPGTRVNGVAFTLAQAPATVPPATLSGHFYSTFNSQGPYQSGDQVIAGTTVTLTGTDNQGHAVTLTTTTAADGSYTFTGVAPGTYAITRPVNSLYPGGPSYAGTDGTATDGTVQANGDITNIVLKGGDSAVNYDFDAAVMIGGGG